MPWVTALIPTETESEQTYSEPEVYKVAHAATRRILQLPLCVMRPARPVQSPNCFVRPPPRFSVCKSGHPNCSGPFVF